MNEEPFWREVNSEGDTINLWDKGDEIALAYRNDREGYAGATVFSKEALKDREQSLRQQVIEEVLAEIESFSSTGHIPYFDESLTQIVDRIKAKFLKETE